MRNSFIKYVPSYRKHFQALWEADVTTVECNMMECIPKNLTIRTDELTFALFNILHSQMKLLNYFTSNFMIKNAYFPVSATLF